MMNQKQEALLGLPLTNAEREWLTDRLETLSVKKATSCPRRLCDPDDCRS